VRPVATRAHATQARLARLAPLTLLLGFLLACGESRAAGDPPASHRAKRDTVVDSALVAAHAATERIQAECQSDSALARVVRAEAMADSARLLAARDSAVRDSMRRDSLAHDTTLHLSAARRAKLTSATRPMPRPDTSTWVRIVARRALSQTPLPGSLFPGCLVVSYYGNPLSKRMGILGEVNPDSMLARLKRQAAAYQRADSTVHVLPALELIATVAQGSPGRDGKYRLRMPDALVDKVAGWAEREGYLLILDIQVGHSDVTSELKPLIPWLRKPNVHLALDPEFAMKNGKKPGTVIGTLDAAQVNVAVDTLARLVSEYQLPPKMLIVHRFTRPMLTNRAQIRLDPRVQLVIDMDGFGAPHLKRSSYQHYVEDEAVQFTGFKLFYKNDKPILTPEQVLGLTPRPVFVMYQ
jgi:hypothetical protein